MWIRLEDDFFHHPKVKAVSRLAQRFHIEKMCFCGRWLTDGRVPNVEVRGKQQTGHADQLVRAGIWHRAKDLRTVCAECWKMVGGKPGDGWVIHDFLKYNFSKVEAERRSAASREVRVAGGKARAATASREHGKFTPAPADSQQDASSTPAERTSSVPYDPDLTKEQDLSTNGEGYKLAREIVSGVTKTLGTVPSVSSQEIQNEAARTYGRQLDQDEIA